MKSGISTMSTWLHDSSSRFVFSLSTAVHVSKLQIGNSWRLALSINQRELPLKRNLVDGGDKESGRCVT